MRAASAVAERNRGACYLMPLGRSGPFFAQLAHMSAVFLCDLNHRPALGSGSRCI